jgi:3-oxoacyl-(acyl-carrier-protein) synthase
MLFPNTVINSPAGFVSIFFGLTGPNTTVSDGVASGLAAFDYAATLLQRGAADEVLAGGFEELSQWVYLGLHNAGRLSGSRPGDPDESAPFDARRTGVLLGEGAAFFRLQPAARVAATGAAPLGWMSGEGEAFVPGSLAAQPGADPDDVREAMVRSMRAALAAANLEPREVDAVWASASGARDLDQLEAQALATVFGERVAHLPIVALKGALGECFGASAALQVAGALAALRDGIVPPTVGFTHGDAHPELRGISSGAQRVELRHVLVNAFGGLGNNRSLVLTRP